MNNTTKTTAAVAAAAAVAAGVALFTATEPAEQMASPGIDDVAPVTVEIPRVEIPQVAVPQVDVPGVELFRVVSPLELEALGIPAVEMPRAAAGSAAAPGGHRGFRRDGECFSRLRRDAGGRLLHRPTAAVDRTAEAAAGAVPRPAESDV